MMQGVVGGRRPRTCYLEKVLHGMQPCIPIKIGAARQRVRGSVARAVLRQLAWADHSSCATVRLEVAVGEDVATFEVDVHEEGSPSFIFGDEQLRWFVAEGWGLDLETVGQEELDAVPKEVAGDLVFEEESQEVVEERRQEESDEGRGGCWQG